MKFLLPILFLVSGWACAEESSQAVFNKAGDYLGEVWHEETVLTPCDSSQVDCKHEDPIVCAFFGNETIVPIRCTLTVSALLAEPFTGMTKTVTDRRQEIAFFNQRVRVCFNFGKDEFNAWDLIDTSEPRIRCRQWDEGLEEEEEKH